MKRIGLSLLIIGMTLVQVIGCPVCERNQPKVVRGLLHGGGPDSTLDYIIVGLITLISLVTLYLTIKWLIKPGEKEANHIKRFIINTNDHE